MGDLISEDDLYVPERDAPYVACEWGYSGCTGADRTYKMVSHDDGWMCWACYRTAEQEWLETRGGY